MQYSSYPKQNTLSSSGYVKLEEQLLKSGSSKIKKVKIVYKQKIIGLQFTYQYQDGTEKLSEEIVLIDPEGVRYEVITLSNDEYFIQVYGQASDVIENIGFKTNLGREFKFGEGTGIPFYHYAPPGNHFTQISSRKIGYQIQVQVESQPIQQFNITQYNQQYNYNQQNNVLNYNINRPATSTTSYQPIQSTYPIIYPESNSFNNYPNLGQQNTYNYTQYTSQPNKSLVAGTKSNFDTQYWDDYTNILQSNIQGVSIQQITLYSDDDFVAGISILYSKNGINLQPVYHMSNQSPIKRQVTQNLSPGEFISEILGRSSQAIDYLIVKTNLGKSIELGGIGGYPFQNIVTPGTKVIAFGGGHNKQLHNLFVYSI